MGFNDMACFKLFIDLLIDIWKELYSVIIGEKYENNLYRVIGMVDNLVGSVLYARSHIKHLLTYVVR